MTRAALALGLLACTAPAAPRPPPAPRGALEAICADHADSPIGVACLVGRPVSSLALDCEATPVTACAMAAPAHAALSCRYIDVAPPATTRTAWVAWTSGDLVAVPSSRAAPSAPLTGVEHREELPAGRVPGRLDELVGIVEAAGCTTTIERSTWRHVARGTCGALELELTGWLPGTGPTPSVIVLAMTPELAACRRRVRLGG